MKKKGNIMSNIVGEGGDGEAVSRMFSRVSVLGRFILLLKIIRQGTFLEFLARIRKLLF